jgi:serine phosphatase RsbU (regulator of sigma subunit)
VDPNAYVTVHEGLVALGADDREALDAAGLLARAVPVGRPVVINEDVIAAARAGDIARVTRLLELMARENEAEQLRREIEKQFTDQLQEEFQQRQLPVLHNVGFSATYVPAAAGLSGGDWYDAFELPDGRIMFSIGDVAGHGVDAAVTMTRARNAILAVALGATDPGEVFERANVALLLQDTKFATAVCGYIDPRTLRVSYATAGHPPAILVGLDGVAQHLLHDGLPLGVAADARYPSFEVQVDHGAILVLYTDGLLEYDRDLLAGERRILETVSAIARRRLDNPAAAICDAIFTGYEPTDDVAIMTIAFSEHPIDATAAEAPQWSVGFRGVRAGLASRPTTQENTPGPDIKPQ